MKLIIIGGGFLGQLLHTVFPKARVFDWRPSAPKVAVRTIGPQYLWEPIPGLRNREYDVITTIDGEPATDRSILAYKKKVGKQQDNGDWRAQFQHVMKGYDVTLPPDRVEYGRRVESIDCKTKTMVMAGGWQERYDSLISTIPLPALMTLCGLPVPPTPFESRPIFVRTYEHFVQTSHPMYVDYLSDPNNPAYRDTIRDGKRFIEALAPADIDRCIRLMPGKIYPNPLAEHLVKNFTMTNIWCLGRYATWSPDELAHETYHTAIHLAENEYV